MTVINNLYELNDKWNANPEWRVTSKDGCTIDVHITDTVVHKKRNQYNDGKLDYSFEVIGYEVDDKYPSQFGYLYYKQSGGEPLCLLWKYPDSNPDNRTEVEWGTITSVEPLSDEEVDA